MSMNQAQDLLPTIGPAGSQSFLVNRVREEAAAAADATSIEATLVHLKLAIAYARRFGEEDATLQARSWADEHRVW